LANFRRKIRGFVDNVLDVKSIVLSQKRQFFANILAKTITLTPDLWIILGLFWYQQ
jgi:hypothetical protein